MGEKGLEFSITLRPCGKRHKPHRPHNRSQEEQDSCSSMKNGKQGRDLNFIHLKVGRKGSFVLQRVHRSSLLFQMRNGKHPAVFAILYLSYNSSSAGSIFPIGHPNKSCHLNQSAPSGHNHYTSKPSPARDAQGRALCPCQTTESCAQVLQGLLRKALGGLRGSF